MDIGRIAYRSLLGAALIVAGTAGMAAAGGGCHGGATQGSGEVVELVDACFAPTTLRIDLGDTVTFVNHDDFVHNVVANGWGHFQDLRPGARFTMSFEEDGVYPFACTYHPGMTGAIVVGDGTGSGNGAVLEVTPPEAPTPTADGTSGGSMATGAAGLVIGLGVGYGISRSRRSAAAAG